ncbi:HlyD family secretion protein [Stakelama pacifica]|uniref:Membrane fusion protein (Multidrug efflux system) n=1 Tax=Stakelama pacifica TaxID=517720 RepID=A0A4R6FHF2_9SPHN|nr:HlyD family secretion protein [Stakelama pacifica]TDN80220.1 membrane fusion protein (multidrug efflux system) [Stakelama pacifica]GGO97685.1 multidrug export protein EmrA [Stakelama pacifica]
MSADENGATPNDGQNHETGDENRKRPFYKRPVVIVVALLIIGVIGVAGTLYYLHARQFVSTDDAFIDAHIVRVQPQISGQLTYVADADNKHVKAGQLLAKIEPTRPRAELDQAQAGVAQAEAAITEALGRLEAAQAQVAEARAQAVAPAAEAKKAADDLARYRRLNGIDTAAVAGQQLDAVRAQAVSAAAKAAAARRAVESAEAQVTVARRAVDAAKAQRSAAQAQVDQAQVTVGDLEVRAPIAGQVTNRSVNIGSTVAPSSQMMAIVPDHIWVTANFKETQITDMKPGDPVDIEVDAFPGVHFHGHVDSFQRGAGQAFALLPPQNATGNYVKVVQRVPVRIEFDRKDGGVDPSRYPIGPGMSVVPTVKVR